MTAMTILTKFGNRDQKNYVEAQPEGKTLVSYGTNIARELPDGSIVLDARHWNYSASTRNARIQFLEGEKTDETRKKIEAGIYKLVNL